MAANKCRTYCPGDKYHHNRRPIPWSRGTQSQTWFLVLLIEIWALAPLAQPNLAEYIKASRLNDSAMEQTRFCRGPCHLAKFSYRLSAQEIEFLNAENLLQILQYFPGVFAGLSDSQDIALGMYGGVSNNNIALYIDGVRQNNPFDGWSYLYLPAQAIDSITLYFGPGGVWFAQGTLFGTIWVQTKRHTVVRSWTNIGSQPSVAGGYIWVHNKPGFKAGILASYTSISDLTQDNAPFKKYNFSWIERHNNKGVWVSLFMDHLVSRSHQVHLLGQSQFAFSQLGPLIAPYSQKILSSTKNRLMWHNYLQLVQISNSRTKVDIAATTSIYRHHHNYLLGPAESIFPLITLSETIDSGRIILKPTFYHHLSGGHELSMGFDTTFEGAYHHKPDLRNSLVFASPFKNINFTPHFFRGITSFFLQDDWKITDPLLLSFGARALLPFKNNNKEAQKFHILPKIGLVISPMSQLRAKLVYQSSIRPPSFFELSPPRFNNFLLGDYTPKTSPHLFWEKMRSLEASLWMQQNIGSTRFSNNLTGYFSRMDQAIRFDSQFSQLNNNFVIDIIGLRSNTEILFSGGHHIYLGIYYTIAHSSPTNNQLYNYFVPLIARKNTQKIITKYNSLPKLIGKMSLNFNLLSYGNLNVSGVFYSFSHDNFIIRQPKTLLSFGYVTRALYRYLRIHASITSIIKSPDIQKQISPNHWSGYLEGGGILATIGCSIGS